MGTRICALAAATLFLLSGCGRGEPGRDLDAAPPATVTTGTPAPAGSPSPSASAEPQGSGVPHAAANPYGCAGDASGWSCDQQRRFADALAYVRRQPGQLGVVVHDRIGGATWRAGATGHPSWTASTIKLAIAATLLERQRAGQVALDPADRAAMAAMLSWSSNDAATALWTRYDGPGMLDRFRGAYGMGGLSVVPGYDLFWRHLACTADDLHALMAYVLERMHPTDRAYLVDALRGVAANQRWGVWAAGPGLRPGNKDGWAFKPDDRPDHWVTHSVGFAGQGERYVVAVTYELPAGAPLSRGVRVVSDVVALVFGAPTPAPVQAPPA